MYDVTALLVPLFPAEYDMTVPFSVPVAGSFAWKRIETDLLKRELALAFPGVRAVRHSAWIL